MTLSTLFHCSFSRPQRDCLAYSVMEQLYSIIRSQRAAFCCGGAIPVVYDENPFTRINSEDAPISSSPVTLRWDLPSGQGMRKLTLPVPNPPTGRQGLRSGVISSTATEDTPDVAELLKDCAPASFGHKGKEVLDESNRKAVKLDSSQFCTNFNPYDCGIVDAIHKQFFRRLPGIRAIPRSRLTSVLRRNCTS